MSWLFVYLQIFGVYGVATLRSAVPSSDGIFIGYDFKYDGETYSGSFTGGNEFHIGDKYFVIFSRNYPDRNLLKYNRQVPLCLEDSMEVQWQELPDCLEK